MTRAGAPQDQIDEPAMAAYLRDRLGADELTISSLTRTVGGMSRQTWFAEVSGRRGRRDFTDSLTLRMDHPDGSVVPVPLRHEYDVFAALRGSDVPVAEALWYEGEPESLGTPPFYVRRTVQGSASASRLYRAGNEELRARVGRDLATKLAAVHTLDWSAAGLDTFLPVPKPGPECALLELDRWVEHYRSHDPEPMPVVETLLSWLRRNAPTEVERVSLVWGDVGVGNIIYTEDGIAGLTDWEHAHLGDPMKDWASALWRGVDSLLERDELFEIYERASGLSVDQTRIDYYTVFIDVEYVCTSFPLLAGFTGGRTRESTFARLGMGVPYFCMDHALTAIGR